MPMIKVVITDDHPMIVTGLEMVLNATGTIRVTATYRDGTSLLAGLRESVPDVLLLDLQLPDILGKDLAETILQEFPDIRIVILTSLEATHHVEEIMEMGCMGYLLKSNTGHQNLIDAVHQAYQGIAFIDNALSNLLLTNIQKRKKQQQESTAVITRREQEVLQLIVRENKNQDIADILHISVRTVECHRLSLIHKLRVKNTAGMVKKAIELRLVNP